MKGENQSQGEANIALYLQRVIPAVDFLEIYEGEGDGSVREDRPKSEGHTIYETAWPRPELGE